MNLAGDYSELAVRRALKNSKVLSSDVSAAFDPNYPSVMEKKNSAYFGKGLVFNKYTGARGKSGSMMPTQSMLQGLEISWIQQMFHSRQRSLER